MTTRRPTLLFTLLLALVSLMGCARDAGTPEPVAGQRIRPLPELDLSGAEEAARAQLKERRAAVTEQAAAGAADGELADAYGELALLYLTYGFLDAAEVAVTNARALDGTDFRWPYLEGYLRLLRGDQQAAIRDLEASLELQPDNVPALLRLGRAQSDAGDAAAARVHFQAALDVDPQLAPAHEGLGRAAAALGEPEVALRHFERALVLEPRADALHYARAQVLRQLGRLDEAREALAVSGSAVTQIPDPLLQPLGSLAQSVQFFMMQGSEAMVDGRYDEAAASFRTALDRDPGHFDAYRGLAISLQRQGDTAGSAATLALALEKVDDPDAVRLARLRAALHRSLGQLARTEGADHAALEHFLRSLELDPDQPDLLLLAADALARQGRFGEAIARYDALVAAEPEWGPVIWEKRATAWVNLGDRQKAVADFERAVAASPDDARLRERYAAALEYLALTPQPPLPDRERGSQGTAGGLEELADEQRQAADRLAREDSGEGAALWAERAKGHARSGDMDAAIAAFRKALELEPGRTDDRHAMASLLAHVGRLDDARGELLRVLDEQPRRRPAHRDLVAVLILGERYGEARVALQEALRLFPQHKGFALTQVELLATAPRDEVRDGALALDIAQRVSAVDRGPVARQSLAFALAAAGRFDDAVAIQQELLDQAQAAGHEQVAEALRERLERFQAHEPWIAQSPQDIVAPLLASP